MNKRKEQEELTPPPFKLHEQLYRHSIKVRAIAYLIADEWRRDHPTDDATDIFSGISEILEETSAQIKEICRKMEDKDV